MILGGTLIIPTQGIHATEMSAAQTTNQGWVTDNGGEIINNADSTMIFKGGTFDSESNSCPGTYTNANEQRLENGNIVQSVYVYINPSDMAVGEKVGLSASLNGTDGGYKTEQGIVYYAGLDGKVHFDMFGGKYDFGSITEAGIYKLEFRFTVGVDNKVFADFTAYKGENIAVQSELRDLGVTKDQISTSGYLWFLDISVKDGIRVGMPNFDNVEEQAAPTLLPSDWVAGEGYGSVETVKDYMAVLKGDETLNSDNSHTGPYVNTKGGEIVKNGSAVVDEVHVYIDPAEMVQSEKFALTSSLNNKNNEYVDELLVLFQKVNNETVRVTSNMDKSFDYSINEAGLYTLKYSYIPGDLNIAGNFSIWKDGEKVASTINIIMPNATVENTSGRRSVWFSDISVENGLEVYSVTKADYTEVDEAIAKVPGDLSKYTEESVKALQEALDSVVRDLSILDQDVVDGYAAAIKTAINTLEERPSIPWTDLEPSEPAVPLTPLEPSKPIEKPQTPSEPTTPTDPVKPITPITPETPAADDETKTPVSSEKSADEEDKTPDTGTYSNVLLLGFTFIISAIGFVGSILFKRRHQN